LSEKERGKMANQAVNLGGPKQIFVGFSILILLGGSGYFYTKNDNARKKRVYLAKQMELGRQTKFQTRE
jgi:hypothetical protein